MKESKVIHVFSTAQQLVPLNPTLFKGQNYAIGNPWFTYFEKDKSMGANQKLLILFPVFWVAFLFEFKSHVDNNVMIKMVIFLLLLKHFPLSTQKTECIMFLKLIDYDHNI